MERSFPYLLSLFLPLGIVLAGPLMEGGRRGVPPSPPVPVLTSWSCTSWSREGGRTAWSSPTSSSSPCPSPRSAKLFIEEVHINYAMKWNSFRILWKTFTKLQFVETLVHGKHFHERKSKVFNNIILNAFSSNEKLTSHKLSHLEIVAKFQSK